MLLELLCYGLILAPFAFFWCCCGVVDCGRCDGGVAASELLLTVPEEAIEPYDPFGDPSETCSGLCDNFVGEFLLEPSDDEDLALLVDLDDTEACIWKGPEFLGCDPLNPSSEGFPEPSQYNYFYAAAVYRTEDGFGTPDGVAWKVYLIVDHTPTSYITRASWQYKVSSDPDELVECLEFDYTLPIFGASTNNGCSVPGADVSSPTGEVYLETV